MQFTLATIALAAATLVSAQGVPAGIAPSGSPPAGCATTYSSQFEITVVKPSKKRDLGLVQRQSACASDGTLVAALSGGVLTDAKGRIGEIVANHQFQFDGPPGQAGAIYTGGWSVCNNGSLALGPSAVFYECLSGTFYNLYNTPAGADCMEVLIQVLPCGGAGASQNPDGQPTAGQATQITDGQIQATSAKPAVTQITDGQVQATSAKPAVSQITDGQVQASSAAPKAVSQFSDGQIQVTATPTAVAPVSEASEGQPQVTTATPPPVSEASEGQPQVTPASTKSSSAAPVSEASEGQPQVTPATTLSSVASSAVSTTKPAAATVTTAGASMISVGASLMAGLVAAVAVILL